MRLRVSTGLAMLALAAAATVMPTAARAATPDPQQDHHQQGRDASQYCRDIAAPGSNGLGACVSGILPFS